jgi:hypothetical protein
MLLSAVMCAKQLRHRNADVGFDLHIRCFVYNGPFVILTKNVIDIVYRLWVSAKCVVLLGILVVWFYFRWIMNYQISNILFVFPYFIEISKNKILISRCCNRQSCVLNNYATATQLSKCLADSDLVVFGLTGIGPIRKISVLDWFLPYWHNESFYIVLTDLIIWHWLINDRLYQWHS